MTLEIRILSSVLPPVLLLAGLGYFVLTDQYIQKIHKRTMTVALALIPTAVVQDILDYCLTYVTPIRTFRLINSAYGYMIYPVLIVLFYYFIGGKRRYLPSWCLVGINTAVYVITLFTPIAFGFAENNAFERGPLGYTSHVICVILLLNLFYITIRKYGRRLRLAIVPLACLLMLVGAMLMDTLMPGSEKLILSFVAVMAIVCCVLIYIWLHMLLVRQYEEELIAQQRVRIMMSQIQPHFLYNTIATFKALCRTDPEKAATVAEKFGRYLRENLDSLSSEELIPVEKELEHTRVYADIEMVRFENIRVEYKIEDMGYSLPTLTIQPIVENAIRHGVRIREEGIVRVCLRLSEQYHEIVVSDNGIGFDISKTNNSKGTHIGIKNVRERIEKLCGGTMTVDSVPDKGTTVTIRIPKTEETI